MGEIKNFIIILLIGLTGISCSDETDGQRELTMNPEEVVVRLLVTKPYSSTNISSKKESNSETEIHEIQLLVFEEGIYKYRVSGVSIVNSGTAATFNARLLASDKALDLYIVANATTAVLEYAPVEGDSKDQIKENLQMEFPTSASFSYIPMFGRYSLPSGLKAGQLSEIEGVNMLRAIARADVLVGTVPGFELTTIRAYRANSLVQLIPDEEEVLTVTAPSVPVNSTATVNTNEVTVTGNQSVSQLYLSEASVPAESERVKGATCIVVGGKFGNSGTETFYRIDFDPNNTKGSFGQVLRNHHYTFTIQSVAGAGWPTPDEAANHRSAQINVEVKAWDEATEDMYFDTEHHFGVSDREVKVGGKKNAVAIIDVDTDISSYTLQWSDEHGNILGAASNVLTDSYFKVEKSRDESSLVVTALQANSENKEDRMGYFVITASRWKILMSIRQTYTSGQIINLLSFRNSLGHFGVNLLYPKTSAEGRGAGTCGILGNLNNFGPSGTVECDGFNLIQAEASSNTLSDALLATADIIYFNYVAASALGTQDVQNIRKWLESSKNRVMIVSYDGSSINIPILTEFLGTTQNITWYSSNSGSFPLVGKSTTNFFTDLGPFTVSPYTPVSAGFTFQNYDIYHGEIKAGSTTGITPILNGPGGGIVLGVDVSRRIIYMGDIDLNTASNGTGATTTNHINNATGSINNDAAKLIANVFAWAVNVVTNKSYE